MSSMKIITYHIVKRNILTNMHHKAIKTSNICMVSTIKNVCLESHVLPPGLHISPS